MSASLSSSKSPDLPWMRLVSWSTWLQLCLLLMFCVSPSFFTALLSCSPPLLCVSPGFPFLCLQQSLLLLVLTLLTGAIWRQLLVFHITWKSVVFIYYCKSEWQASCCTSDLTMERLKKKDIKFDAGQEWDLVSKTIKKTGMVAARDMA